MIKITKTIAKKVLKTVDAGLVKGVGEPTPGKMCVEAAVCYAMGLPHGDNPDCVSPALRALKIRLNDSKWSSNDARAKGMRRLALAQLGSADTLDEREFIARVVEMTIGKILPIALRAAAKKASLKHKTALEEALVECETAPTQASALKAKVAAYVADAADAAASASYAAYAAAANATDEVLAFFAEEVVKILIEMKAPGCQWLILAPLA